LLSDNGGAGNPLQFAADVNEGVLLNIFASDAGYGVNFQVSGGPVSFDVDNYPVNPCYNNWKHRIGITLGYTTYSSFYIAQYVNDVKNLDVLSSYIQRSFLNPPYSGGPHWSSFANFFLDLQQR